MSSYTRNITSRSLANISHFYDSQQTQSEAQAQAEIIRAREESSKRYQDYAKKIRGH
ncbi:hypothetical protein [Bartonella jaculi]|uniref:Uncharacterized protein n=1 Tax=Bartonella jaculi TaxID=686226 RepID=A0ABP9N748_9HYPH